MRFKIPTQALHFKKNTFQIFQDPVKFLESKQTKSTPLTNTVAQSVIDITGNFYKLPRAPDKPRLTKHSPKVIYWRNQYVYSARVLAKANLQQVTFYKEFKEAFLSGIYYDLEGNKNYAFILLFELIKSFPKHVTVADLETRLKILSAFYPKTRSCSRRLLNKIIQKNGDYRNVHRSDKNTLKNKDLDECLLGISKIDESKRRKIQLDSVAIEEVKAEHSETVEVLNEFLQDEYQDDILTIQALQINKQEIKIDIISKVASSHEVVEKPIPIREPIHLSLLTLFQKNNYSLSERDLEDFARSHNVFKHQLIEKINEICFDCLDDVLIEEEADNYILNEEYFTKIMVA